MDYKKIFPNRRVYKPIIMFKRIKKLLSKNKKSDFTVINNGDSKIVISSEVMAYFNSTLPSPNPKDLEKLIDETVKIIISDRIVEVGRDELFPICDINDKKGIEKAGEHLAIQQEPGGHILDGGYTIFDFYTKQKETHRIEFLGAGSIRWKEKWKEDARLKDGKKFLDWLYDLGVEKPLNEYHEAIKREEIREKRYNDWLHAAPSSILTRLENDADFIFNYDADELLKALRKEFTNDIDLVINLFELYGTGFTEWNGYPINENIPEAILLKFPIKFVQELSTKYELTKTQKHGIARFFGMADFDERQKLEVKKLSTDFKNELLEHVARFHDQYKKDRIKRALFSEL